MGLLYLKPKPSQLDIIHDKFPAVHDSFILRNYLKRLAACDGPIAVDLETTGLDYRLDDIVGIGFYGKGCAFHIPVFHKNFRCIDRDVMVKELTPFFANKDLKICMHNANFDRHFLEFAGIPIKNLWMDTQIAFHVIDDNSDVALKKIIPQLYGVPATKFKSIFNKRNPIENSDPTLYAKYLWQDVFYTAKLAGDMEKELDAQKLSDYFFKIEMKTLNVIFKMETRGIDIDVKRLTEYGDRLKQEISTAKKTVFRIVGDPNFNPNSSKQIQKFVFEDLHAPVVRKGKKSGNPSCDAKAMDEYAAQDMNIPLKEFSTALLDYRGKTKIYSTYIVGILDRIVDGKINPRFRMLTETGRLCVAGDTVLNTDKGDFEISKIDLHKGTEYYILTHRGRPRRILNRFYKGKEEMYSVSLSNGNTIKTTAGHRFLTPSGWRHLYELKEGSLVEAPLCSDFQRRYSSIEAKLSNTPNNTGREIICPNISKGKFILDKDRRKISSWTPYTCFNESLLGEEIQERIEDRFSNKLFQQHEGEPERLACSDYFVGSEKAVCAVERRKAPYANSERDEHQRIFCASEHKALWPNEQLSAPSSDAACGLFLCEDARSICSGTVRGSKEFLLQPTQILRSFVSRISSNTSDRMVHKKPSQDTCLLETNKTDSEGSCLLEHQSLRGSSFDGVVGIEYPTPASTFYRQEFSTGLLFSSEEIGRRNRRRLSSKGFSYTATRHEERKGFKGEGNSLASFQRKRNVGRSAACGFGHTEETIISINPIGLQDVWDIEVEEDHSYVAHGFINHNSSSDPNAQNIPRKSEIRYCFIAPEGWDIIDLDYSQIELRIVAHLSNDPKMVDEYNKENSDIHQATADACGCDRQDAKPINFGLIYRMHYTTLAKLLKISERKAEKYWRGYFNNYKGVYAWQEKMARIGRKNRMTRTVLGRPRRLLRIHDSSKWVREHEERKGINHPVQGTAGELIKLAMIDCEKDTRLKELKCRLISQVHDELLFRCPHKNSKEALGIIKKIMETSLSRRGVTLRVPVIAEGGVGATWGDAKG